MAFLELSDSATTTGDAMTVNYTGAASGGPTGYTRFSAQATVTATNSSVPTGVANVGWRSIVKGKLLDSANNRLIISSIAAGNWTFTFNFGGTGTNGPTVKIGVKGWSSNGDATSNALLFGLQASAALTTANPAVTITFNPGALSFPAANLYLEFYLFVQTAGTNLTANAITINQVSATIPAVSYGTNLVSEATAANASDAVARQYRAPRAPSESLTSASDARSRIFAGHRSEAESVTSASDARTRVFHGARTITRTGGSADDSVNADVGGNAVRGVNESATVATATPTRTYRAPRSMATTVTTSSAAVARVYHAFRTLTPSSSASDTVTRIRHAFRAVASTCPTSFDTPTNQFTLIRHIFDLNAGAFDGIARNVHGGRANALSTGTSASDAAARALQQLRTLTQTSSSASDSLRRVAVAHRSTSMSSLVASAAIARKYTAIRAKAESLTAATDNVNRRGTIKRTKAESLSAAVDTAARIKRSPRTILTSLALPSDVIARRVQLHRVNAFSAIAATDSPAKIAHRFRALAETIGTPAALAVVRHLGYHRTVPQSLVSALEAIARHSTAHRSNALATGTLASDHVGGAGFAQRRQVFESHAAAVDAVLAHVAYALRVDPRYIVYAPKSNYRVSL